MLAPRKRLWSTPLSAIDHCLEWIPLKQNDSVLDIGCGDGRILIEWAERISSQKVAFLTSLSFLGIDIDPDRIQESQSAAKAAIATGRLSPEIRMNFVCANALESVELFQNATVIFLYLIPRGLKQILPLLKDHANRMRATIRVATYMSKLPLDDDDGEKMIIKLLGRATCRVEHQREAAWPLYFYEIRPHGAEE
ncbi:ribosomal protein L11 methylase [Nitzschia inconspicua]|uniref:Ribosomal protein L11 methylase n=1 Tax=Nitzschia inconspicua TaxID=303405 RepID=A0A9K3LIM0_9STRA|nr:ribosomal protein L11 methylase [Nitzschia inconspicua]